MARAPKRRDFVHFSLLLACLLPVACQSRLASEAGPATPAINSEVYRRAENQRAERLEREVAQLRADLSQAEAAVVAAESGLLGKHSRADAVSGLAEAHIQVERAERAAPWRQSQIAEARSKLDEANRLVGEGHFGAAHFLVYRATRIADQVQQEARKVAATPGTRFIRGRRVNLRAGPTTAETVVGVLQGGTPVFPEQHEAGWVLVRTAAGSVGWIHQDLISGFSPAARQP